MAANFYCSGCGHTGSVVERDSHVCPPRSSLAADIIARNAPVPVDNAKRKAHMRLIPDADLIAEASARGLHDSLDWSNAALVDELLRRNVPEFAAVLTDEKLRAECVLRAGPPRGAHMHEIVSALRSALLRDDTNGACDVIDKMFLVEWPDTAFKLQRDIRGLAVAAFDAGRAADGEWKRRALAAEEKLANPLMMVPAMARLDEKAEQALLRNLYPTIFNGRIDSKHVDPGEPGGDQTGIVVHRGVDPTHYVQSQDTRERGTGITSLPTKPEKRDDCVDMATLADLLADDAGPTR